MGFLKERGLVWVVFRAIFRGFDGVYCIYQEFIWGCNSKMTLNRLFLGVFAGLFLGD